MKKRILVVEDNEQNLYLATFILEKNGFEVIPAKDGLEAIEKAKAEKPELILMDMQLPEMDGFEATRKIKSIPEISHIPIVAVTSYAMVGDREKALAVGCVGYIEKPFMPATFVAEEALRERERYFRSLLFAIHEDILVITRDYRITDVNNTFLVTTGFKREEAIGRHCYKVSHGYNEPCDRQGEECMLQTVFETGKPHKCGHFHMRTDGSKVWVDILLSPLRDEKGNVTHVIEAIRDVTDLHQAQEALKESEKRFRLLYENAHLSYQSLDEDGHIVEVNKAWIDFLGYSKNEVIGQWLGEFLALDYQEYFRNNFSRFKSAGEIHGMKFEMLRKDGAHIIVSIDGSIGHDEQGCFKAHCIMHDITEREQLERQLRQAQKMEAIGTLAGGIAHDFNNILGAVIGCTEMSLFDVPEGTPVHRHLLEVLNAGNRAKDLVNQILAFSRQTEQERKPVKISLIIKETLKLLRASLPTTIKIRQYIETDSDMVLADPTQIHQVLMNLCTNAAHAMREKG